MYSIILIRHGETTANKELIFGNNEGLTLRGKRQAHKARKRYKELYIDKWYSSELYRAVETANILSKKLLSMDTQLAEFNEIYFGDVTGKPIIEGYEDDIAKFCEEHKGDNVAKRAEKAVESIYYFVDKMAHYPEHFPSKRIAIVTSDTIIRCIVSAIITEGKWESQIITQHLNNLEGIDLLFREKDMSFHSFSYIHL